MKVSMSRTKSIGMLILVSTIVLYGAVLPVSAVTPPPNWFLGDATLNGEPAPTGTTIEAFIQGDSRGNVTVDSPGKYANLCVVGDSADNNIPITFTVDGLPANETGIWIAWTQGAQILDLTAGDAPAGDITYPDITITAPTSGASFTTATITVSGTASDNEGISKVEVRVGSRAWIDASGTTSWSTTVTLDLGPKTIYARANDTSGNSREVQVDDVSYVVGGSEDTTPPTISIDSPSDGYIFTTETIPVSGTASDNEGVSKVEVRVGSGDWIDASGTTSWSTTVTVIQGVNMIDVRAIDDTGNPSETTSVTVARNPPGSTPPSSEGISGEGVVSSGRAPTGADAQPESGETVESGTSDPTTTGTLTSAATATKSDAEPEENQGLIPGFEAVFAIAGLLVVIYLIRNRV